MKVRIKRVYEPVEPGDGVRVLVDRLWPRGLSKEAAKVDLWVKELAPSTELRKWFHSEAGDWAEFKKRYRRELTHVKEQAAELRDKLGSKPATFLYATKAESQNHAKLLRSFLERL